MFKAKTLKDFEQLQRAVDHLNKENVWKLRLEIKQEHSECDLYVVDAAEELYYDGYLFEEAIGFLDSSLQQDTDDDNAYFDCICPGRWIADFKGRSKYDEEFMELDIHIAIGEAMLKYMEDNGLEPHWTDELRKRDEELPKLVVNFIKEVLK